MLKMLLMKIFFTSKTNHFRNNSRKARTKH